MAKIDTFTISRNDLRKVLVNMGMSDKNVISLFGVLDKAHKHANAISFVTMLERMGMNREKSTRILRRIGLDDITIEDVMNMVDESKINAEIGRIYEATVDFS
jgi:hypothetical protein